jgi:hypothetical protein
MREFENLKMREFENDLFLGRRMFLEEPTLRISIFSAVADIRPSASLSATLSASRASLSLFSR